MIHILHVIFHPIEPTDLGILAIRWMHAVAAPDIAAFLEAAIDDHVVHQVTINEFRNRLSPRLGLRMGARSSRDAVDRSKAGS